ncbi:MULTISPECIES: hypothetical protein [unclassified Variovorax]|uniref:hypothetical protein n=1 Tax=unclassified Variovorax TaxID=663243 RepID=UPI0025769E8F|nr:MULTISPECIES: hypothetical protein [unclassified Variovorax]MDM0090475.1 hypothetical protein [Variovorax sp. J22G40]MDM0147860.1 hypothetical protein [Variovorax sp. J2P1-31]
MKPFKTIPRCLAAVRLALAVAACASTNAFAQAGVIVNDPQSMGKQVAEFAKQAKRWSDTLAQYQKEIAHYQQMIATAVSLNFQSQLPTAQLQKITDTSLLIQQACPGSGNLVATVIGRITPLNLNGPIKENQDRICQNIVQLRATSYNETVDMLDRLNQYNELFKKVDDLRNSLMGSASSQGDMQANTNEAVRNANKLQNEVSNWQARMNVYETAIRTLESQQSILARVALKGASTWTGRAIQAASFAAAFSSH